MPDIPNKPITRAERFLNAAATGDTSGLPEPITREEQYLKAIAEGSGGGRGDPAADPGQHGGGRPAPGPAADRRR